MSIGACAELEDAWGPVLIAGLRGVADATSGELADAAGCSVDLVADIESGKIRPYFSTLERIANSVALEIRMGVRFRPFASPVSHRFDHNLARVRGELAAENAWRLSLGISPVGPPAAVMPDWDGTDPAPIRQFNAWPNRTDGGGNTAINVAYGRNCVLRADPPQFARRTGLSVEQLADIESGIVPLRLDHTEALLNRTNLEQYAHIELYDAHDDELHLLALSRTSKTQSASIVADP